MKAMLVVGLVCLVAGFIVGLAMHSRMSAAELEEAASLATDAIQAQEATQQALDSLEALQGPLEAIVADTVRIVDTVRVEALQERTDSLVAVLGDSLVAAAVEAERQEYLRLLAQFESRHARNIKTLMEVVDQQSIALTRQTEELEAITAERDFWMEKATSGGQTLDVSLPGGGSTLAIAGAGVAGILLGWLASR